MGALTGMDAALYRDAAGATATTLMTNVRDLKYPNSFAEANTSRRGQAVSTVKPTRRAIEVTWTMIGDDADADLTAIRNAFNNKTALAFLVLDKVAGKGVDGDFYVMKFDRNEPDEAEQTYDVVIKPAYITRVAVPV